MIMNTMVDWREKPYDDGWSGWIMFSNGVDAGWLFSWIKIEKGEEE